MKKMENFFRRALSMLMCICMLTGNVGGALAEVPNPMSYSTEPLMEYVSNNDYASVQVQCLGITNHQVDAGKYKATYLVNVELLTEQADSFALDVEMQSDFESASVSCSALDSVSATKENNTIKLSATAADGSLLPKGAYQLQLDVMLTNDQVAKLIAGQTNNGNLKAKFQNLTLGKLESQTQMNPIDHSLFVTPVVTTESKVETVNGKQYVRWDVHIDAPIGMNGTTFKTTVSPENITMVKYGTFASSFLTTNHGTQINAYEDPQGADSRTFTLAPYNPADNDKNRYTTSADFTFYSEVPFGTGAGALTNDYELNFNGLGSPITGRIMVDGYKGGSLEYNSTRNAFTTYQGGKYYNSSSPLGIAGSFHLVAFEDAYLHVHTNGNVLAKRLHAYSNFGTNPKEISIDELTYVVDYAEVHSNSASRNENVLALGAGNTLELSDHNNKLKVNGTELSTPKNVIQDTSADTPFIDLGTVRAEISSLSGRLAGYSNDVGVSVEELRSDAKIVRLTSDSGAGYLNLTADQLNSFGGNGKTMQMHFTSQNSGTIVINVDCSNASSVNMPNAIVYINGVPQSTGEVVRWDNGKVIWNFINANNTAITANNMTGMILAPGATVTLASNVNGTVVADVIHVRAESHRTDFVGTTSPARANFSATKTIGASKTPSSTEKFTFKLYQLNSDKTWTLIETKQNSGRNVIFDYQGEYTKAGVYQYKIVEEPTEGYTAEQDTFYINVTVSEMSSGGGDKKFTRAYEYYDKNSNKLDNNDDVHFVNNAGRTPSLSIVKYDKDAENVYLEGAEFALHKVTVVEGQESYGEPLETVVTDNNGTATFYTKLPYSADDHMYQIFETKCPEGYQDLYHDENGNIGWRIFVEEDGSLSLKTWKDGWQTVGTDPANPFNGCYHIGNTFYISNELKNKNTSLNVQKNWNDDNDRDHLRPTSIELTVYRQEIAKTFDGQTGEFIETVVDEYLMTEDMWAGEVATLAEGAARYTKVVMPDSNGNWACTFTDLPIYSPEGYEYRYSVRETPIPGYSTSYSENADGTIIVNNTHITERVMVSGTKVWNDGNAYAMRPDSLTIRLFRKVENGKELVTSRVITPKQDGTWPSYEFTGLPKYGSDGKLIEYFVEEVTLADYTSTVAKADETGYKYTITNNLEWQQLTDLKITKIWNDNHYVNRPTEITVIVKRNDGWTKNVVLSGDYNNDNWTYELKGLIKKDKEDKEYTYTVEELTVEGYETVITGSETEGFVITNKGENIPEVVTATLEKIWGIAPTASDLQNVKLNFKLYRKDVHSTSVPMNVDLWVEWNGQEWVSYAHFVTIRTTENYGFEVMLHEDYSGPLPTKDSNGEPYTYYFEEIKIYKNNADVTYLYTKNEQSKNNVTTITNTEKTIDKTNVTVTKEWYHRGNPEEYWPTSIQVTLKRWRQGDGVDTDPYFSLGPVTLSADENGQWTYTWNDLEEGYYKEDGTFKEYRYYTEETGTGDYIATYSREENNIYGLKIKNTYDDSKKKLTVKKDWIGDIGSSEVWVVVNYKFKDGGEEQFARVNLNQSNGWTYSWNDMPTSKDNRAVDYYIVKEETQLNGYSAIYSGDGSEHENGGFKVQFDAGNRAEVTVTNKKDTRSVTVNKVWVGEPAESVTVVLYKSLYGNVTEYSRIQLPVEIDGQKVWSFTWDELPIKENYGDISYIVKEEPVDGYTTTYSGENGQASDTGFTAAFYNGNSASATITNSEGPQFVTVKLNKVWDDAGLAGERPTQLSFDLYRQVEGGEPEKFRSRITIDKDWDNGSGWVHYSNRKLPLTYDENGNFSFEYYESGNPFPARDNNGNPYIYYFREVGAKNNEDDLLPNYDISYEQNNNYETTVTNQRGDKTVDIPVVKVWDDSAMSADQTPVHADITLQLVAGDKDVAGQYIVLPIKNENGTIKVGEDGKPIWSYTFENLPEKDADKNVITYTVREIDVPENYVVSYGTDDKGNPVVTNTYVAPVEAQIEATKTLIGKNLEAGMFTFQLFSSVTNHKATEPEIPMPEGAAAVKSEYDDGERVVGFANTVTNGHDAEKETNPNDWQSKVVFPYISYKLSDMKGEDGVISTSKTFTYSIREIPGGESDIIYDETSYDVVVTVGYNSNSKELSIQSITYDNAAAEPEFKNTYVTSTTAQLSATKELTGKQLTAGAFTFELAADTAGAPMPSNETVVNDANGNITFGDIAYTLSDMKESNGNVSKEKIFTYTIKELGADGNGITIDKTVYYADVTVTMDNNGKLTASAPVYYTDVATNPVAAAKFSNTYTTAPAELTISVDKKLVDEKGAAVELDVTGKFTFTLSAKTENAPMPDDKEAKNAENENSFGKITFNAPDTYTYTVTETGEVAGVVNGAAKEFTFTVEDDGKGNLVIEEATDGKYTVEYTNTYEVRNISVTKEWEGREDKKYPESVQVTLNADGAVVAGEGITNPVTLNAANQWNYTWSNLPKYIDSTGKVEIKYTVEESGLAAGYTGVTTGDMDTGFTITNTYGVKPIDVSFPVKKELKVESGTGLKEAKNFTFELSAVDGAPVPATTILNIDLQSGEKTGTFGPITYTAAGTYTYTIKETSTVDGVTNDAEKTVKVTVVDNGNGTLSATADSTTENPVTFTNTYKAGPAEAAIVVKKVLVGVPEGQTAPVITEQYTFQLKDAGGNVLQSKKNAADGSVTFEEISYDTVGTYTYTVTESGDVANISNDTTVKTVTVTVVDNGNGTMTATADSTAENPFEFTNTYVEPIKAELKAKKTVTGEGKPALEADQFTFELYEGDRKIGEAKNAADGTVTFELEKEFTLSDAGNTFTYTIKESNENAIDGFKYDESVWTAEVEISLTSEKKLDYVVKYTKSDETNTNQTAAEFVNQYEKTELSGKKIWVDENNQYQNRPVMISVDLYRDGVKIATVEPDLDKTNTNEWTWTIKDLDKYVDNKEVTYTAEEVPVTGYTTTQEGNNFTNTLKRINVPVEKKWEDDGNSEGFRPAQIQLQLVKGTDKTPVGEAVIVTAVNGEWKHTFEDLPEYENRQKIVYSVVETAVAHYDTKVERNETTGALTVTNSRTPEKVTVAVKKVWDDADNQDGERPDSLKVTLSNGQFVTLSESNNWEDKIENLPKYADGKEITYTWTEDTLTDGYQLTNTSTAELMQDDVVIGTITTLTNKRDIEKTEVKVVKVWSDNNDQDGLRPKSITVQLTADGENVGVPVELNESNSWSHSFGNLDVNKDGVAIVYSVEEIDKIDGYTTTAPVTTKSSDGDLTTITITNTHETAEISIVVKKVWEDANNQDGIRDTNTKVTVQLTADGQNSGNPVELSEANNWTYTFNDLPAKADGKEIEYAVVETAVPEGYTVSYSKNGTEITVTNTHTPATTEATVKKVWSDANNQDGQRPLNLVVTLSNGQSVTLNEDNKWTGTITGLPKYAAGQEIIYTWTEATLPEGYTLTSAKTEGTVTTLTNSYTPEETEATVTKVWDDANDQDGKRPKSLTVTLFADGESTNQSVTLNEANQWTGTISGLPKYAAGQEITYTWTEDEEGLPEGYTLSGTSKEGTVTTLTNSYTPEVTKATVIKAWDDANNQDGIRPDDLTVALMNGETVVEEVTLTADENWTATVENLPKYAAGVEIAYTWSETSVLDGYELTGNVKEGIITTITNKHETELTEATVRKVWEDATNQDGKRPTELKVTLSDGTEVTLNEGNGWTATVKNLPKYAAGKEITYTWTENEAGLPEGYTLTNKETEGTITTLTNSYTPETTEATVKKVWDDANDQDGIRPGSLTVALMNGETKVQDVTLTAAENWTKTISGLAKYAAGVEIEYTWTEGTLPEGYKLKSNVTEGTITTITNTHETATTEAKVIKVWEDDSNRDHKRPETLTVTLSNGQTVTLSESNHWTDTITGLPKYAAGEEITYTWTEATLPKGYTLKSTNTVGTITTITNSYTIEKVDVAVKKEWDDNNNQDGMRTSIDVELRADSGTVENGTATLSQSNNWSYKWEDLPKYNNGVQIVYTVAEKVVPDGYTHDTTDVKSTVDKDTGDVSIELTNHHEPETTEVEVTKVWNDAENQDGKRPTEITYTLWKSFKADETENTEGTEIVADGEETKGTIVKSVTKKDTDDSWNHTFDNLPVYEGGKELVYTVTETVTAEGYTSKVTGDAKNGFTVTNSYTPETTEITATKVWNDASDQDGKRPDKITFELYANGEKVDGQDKILTGTGNSWTVTWTGLDKYYDGGKPVVYTVKEIMAPTTEAYGYEMSESEDGLTITNTYKPETVNVSVIKDWQDNNDQDGKRPETLTINLLKKLDGEPAEPAVIETVVLPEENSWSKTWENLPKYENRKLIIYTVEEVTTKGETTLPWVADYDCAATTISVNNYKFTNTHTPEKTFATVTKVWDDADNQDGKRPTELTVTLSNGTEVTLNEGNGWTATVNDLPKYADGKLITYTWTEGAMPEGYSLTESKVENGTDENGISGTITTITNSYSTEETSATIRKVWNDANDQDGLRPESLVVTLSNGTEVTLDEENHWTATINNLPKYADGVEIEYTWTEEALPDGYELTDTSVDGTVTTLTNSHTPEQTEATVVKVWQDEDDQDGKRPDSLEVTLSNGTKVTLNEGNSWTATVGNLPKYAGGEEIEYTWTESALPEGYKLTSTGKEGTVTTLTNSYVPEQINIDVVKVWDDAENQDGKRPTSIYVQLYANGEAYGEPVRLTDDNLTASWPGLDKCKAGTRITYTVKEGKLNGAGEFEPVGEFEDYTATIGALTETNVDKTYQITITNKHIPELTSATVKKVWEDEEDQDGKRPETLKITLSDGTEVELNEGNGWSATIENLPKYADGELITYTWTEEDLPEGYELTDTSVSGTITTLTNSHTPEETEATVVKVWDDAENQDGKRPTVLTVTLSDGTEVELNEGNGWTATVENLPKYANGVEIEYTWTEGDMPEGYELTDTSVNGTITTLTNSYDTENTVATVKKVWNDKNNQDGIRPNELKVTLSNGTEVTLNEGNGWSATVEDLPKYANGQKINYTWTESGLPEGYELTDTSVSGTITTLTNTHETETTEVKGTKEWVDGENQDNIRPESITVKLLADGEQVKQTTVPNESGVWSWEFTGLDKYKAGELIEYTVTEEAIDGYVPTQETNDDGSITLINTHTPAETEATVKKVWDDADDQDGKRPAELKVTLSNGKEVTLNEANSWTAKVEHLPKYNKGVEIEYTWTEGELPEGYELTGTSVNGTITTLTNSYEPELIDLTIIKVWNDGEDQDGKRPEALTVTLKKGTEVVETVTLNKGNSWTATVEDQPKYENGEEIEYTWTESALPEGYELTGTSVNGYVTTLTNTHVPAVTEATVLKVWEDAENQDGKRPTELKVTLSNGTEVTLNEGNKWTATINNLPMYADGELITYTWTEEELPEGYVLVSNETEGTITTITNKHDVEMIQLTVKKVWDDAENQDGKRPNELKVNLSNGTKTVDTVTLNQGNLWTAYSVELPKYADGKLITYTWTEGTLPAGYTLTSTVVEGTITTLTNSHVPEKTEATVKKVWDDANNQDGKRPEDLTVTLKNGNTDAGVVTLNEGNNWTGKIDNLPKYANGTEIQYTWSEGDMPDGYELTGSAKEGTVTTLTNSYDTENTAATVKKVWDDADDQDGLRPESLEVTLSNGTKVTLNEANQWTATINGLPKFANGTEIQYSWTEGTLPEGYKLTGTAKEGTITTLTNTHVPEITEFTVTKVWDDAQNQDGIRPTSILVQLYADGDKYDDAVKLEGYLWSYTWNNLPKNNDGKAIVYTVNEVDENGNALDITGYTKKIEGGTITNTHEPVKTSVKVTKIWNDSNNQDGIRPEEIAVQLLKDGEAYGEAKVLSLNANNWTATWTDLPKLRDQGTPIVYTVVEGKLVEGVFEAAEFDGYTTTVSDDLDAKDSFEYEIINAHTPGKVSISGTKTWDDADNQDGIRPTTEGITINLLANGTKVKSMTVYADAKGNWSWSFTDLDEYENGVKIAYTITEDEVKGYDTTVSGYNVTNKHTPETIDISGTKTWEDAQNQDGIRPDSITINLLANGEKVASQKVTKAEEWKWSFTGLAKYKAAQEITYTITEDEVEGYETTVSGYNVTNTHTPGKVTVSGTKTWDDADNQDGKRPGSITIRLLADGKEVKNATVSADNAGNWSYSFTDLPEKANGKPIVYTITEDKVEGYDTTVSGYNVTNKHTPETIDISGSKTWNDAGNQDGKRPESITINLLADGTKVASKTVTKADEWKWSFTELDKYADGEEIEYTITEDAVANYTTEIKGYNVTNTHEPEKTKVEGGKTWEDAQNQDGKRPGSITINLLANGTKVASKTVTKDDEWKWSFTELDKYADGEEIEYTITEDAVANYTTEIKGYNVTNTHEPEKTKVEGSKTWEDAQNQDGIRPASITINLLANGEVIKTVSVSEANEWKWSFTDLDKYADGEEIVYTITEDAVANYTTEIKGYNVTNTHEPEKTKVEGIKTWNDAGNQDGKRPASITINLLADGTKVASKTVTKDDEWKWSFTGLDKYKAGKEIAYTITEDAVDDYTTTVTGYDVENSYKPGTTSVTVSKSWNDDNNRDGVRPASITFNLLANGEKVDSKTVTEADGWKWTFTDLPIYEVGKVGIPITYTVTEDKVEDYTTTFTGDAETGFVFTNTHINEKTKVEGSKTWNDNENQDGKRPASITINLLADGTKVDSKTVTEDDEWKWSFTELNKYRDHGVEIVYTITEDKVDDYTASITGYDVTNTHEIEKIEVSGSKTWNDAENQDGKRPESITIRLLADGEEVANKTVTKADEWKWSFTDLDKYADGEEIEYTITEDEVKYYESEVDGYNVTNTHEPEKVNVEGIKTWNDANNQDGKRPESITVNLLADGEQVKQTTVKPNESGVWSWEFTDLDKYKAGKEIVYTVTEEAIDGYELTQKKNEDGSITLINTHTPAETEATVKKVWDDAKNQDGKRPAELKVTLSNGTEVTLNEANSWTATVEHLPKYNKGVEIEYTWTEGELPEGYALTNTTKEGTITTLTNTHVPEKVDVEGIKTWNDAGNQDGKRPASITINLLADGEVIKTVSVTETNGWKWSFTGLDKYKAGTEIAYTITEEEVAEYTTKITGYDVTNTHVPEKVKVEGIKTWNDANNQDGKRPESIKIHLLDGETVINTVIVNEKCGWKWSFTDLPKYRHGAVGVEIKYSIVEELDQASAAAYSMTIDGYNVTNTHELETVDITGSKTWVDLNDKYLKRPDSVTIGLLADGEEIDSRQVTEADNWSWTFKGLPKYKAGQVGQEITYSIKEDVVTGYITTVNDFNVTNTMNLVEFIKTDEQTGKRLPGAKFALYEGPMGSYDPAKPVETWVSTADTKILAGLKVGQTYTIVETEAPSGYAMMVPFQFTVQLTDIPGTYRAFSVSNCHVYRFRKLDSATNGLVHGAHLAVMDANNNIIDSWWSSGDNNGWHEIVDSKLVAGKDYKLVELESPWGYELADPITFSIDEDDGMLFINGSKSMKAELVMFDEPWPEVTPTPEPTETSFTVTKSWEDKDNVLGLRPSSITVHLYRKLRTEAEYPTTPFMTVQMASNGTDTWRFTFDDLPRRSADGVLYDYTVQEVPVDGYVVSYRNNGKTIVNSIPEEDFPPTPTPTLPYVTPTPSPMPRVPAGVQFVDGEWMYIDEYGIPLGGVPLTGDNTNFVLWGMAIGLPLLVAALAAVEIRRRKKLLLAAEDEDEVEETEA